MSDTTMFNLNEVSTVKTAEESKADKRKAAAAKAAVTRAENKARKAEETAAAAAAQRGSVSMNDSVPSSTELPKKPSGDTNINAHYEGKEARETRQQAALNRITFFNEVNQYARSIVSIRYIPEQTLGYVSETTFYADGTKDKTVQLGFAQRNEDGTWNVPALLTENRKKTLIFNVKGAIKARNMRLQVLNEVKGKTAENSTALPFVTAYDQRTQKQNEAWLSDWAIQRAIINPKTTAAKAKTVIMQDDTDEMDNL
jgi:hypothetical protein